MPSTTRKRSKAAATRTAILDAAETHFARHGFDRARLEDVATACGIKRAAIFYHFKDKQELYEKTLKRLTTDLFIRIQEALSLSHAGAADLPARMLEALDVWMDFIGERPTFARLILRVAADAESDADSREAGLGSLFAGPFFEFIEDVLERGEKQGLLKPLSRDPLHIASTLAGATVFFVAAMPAFAGSRQFNPMDAKQYEAHRRDAIAVAKKVLGLPANLVHPPLRPRETESPTSPS